MPNDIPTPAPLIATGAWRDVLSGPHPRLYGSRDHLKSLVQAKPEAYQKDVKGASEQGTLAQGVAGQGIFADGIVSAVEGLAEDRLQARIGQALDHVAAGVTNEHQRTWERLNDVALVFDFFHQAIKPTDRRAMIDWINGHLTVYTDDEIAFHNSTPEKMMVYLRLAYATWGENPQAPALRDYAVTHLYEGRIVPVLNTFGPGGGYTECGWYARWALFMLAEGLEMARRLEGYDGFAHAARFFYERLAYELYQPYPILAAGGAEQFPVEGDGSYVYGYHDHLPRKLRTLLAQYFRGSELAGTIADRKQYASHPRSAVEDFVWEEAPQTAKPLTDLPLAHIATGIGKVYARSDWTEDAAWFRFDCGPFWTNHQHFDVGDFEIFQREPLVLPSGEYNEWGSAHAMNWLIRTVAANSLLVHEPGETWTRMRDGGQNACANDGGQAKKWDWTVATLDEWRANQEAFDRGRILAYENTPPFLFVAADCTQAYAPTKLSQWIRQIVFLRPHTFVIFDRVVTVKPDYEKTWLLHCRREPQIDGQTSVISSPGGQATLTVQTLLPAQAVTRKVYGYTYGGQTFDPAPNPQSEHPVKWRLEVLPGRPQTEDVFLHVLSTDTSPTAATLVQTGDSLGVKIGAALVTFRGTVGGSVTQGNQTHPLAETVKTGKWE